MRALAATNPAAALSTAAKIGIALGSVAALGVTYALASSSSSAATTPAAAGAAAGSGATGPIQVGAPVGAKSGVQTTWTPTTTLTKGQTYRASADAADALSAMGFTVYTDHDSPPADWPSTDTAANRWRVDGVWTQPTTTLAQLFTTVPADLLVWEAFDAGALLAGGGGNITWTPTTTLKQGTRYRASLDLKADLTALGFTIWDQYDTLPADWDPSDTGANRWRIEGPWLEATETFDPTTFAATLESMGVASTLATAIASGVRFWAES
jgi:hypothetical protein